MKKLNLQITLTHEEKEQISQVVANYDEENEIISYQEPENDQIEVTLELKKNKLIRNHKEYVLECYFKEDEITNNRLYLKDQNQTLEIPMKTTKLTKKPGAFEVNYIIIASGETISYKIKY